MNTIGETFKTLKPSVACLFLAALACCAPAGGRADTNAVPLLTILEATRLASNPDPYAHPFRLRGVLTFRAWDQTFLQDATGFVYVLSEASALRPGDAVEVEGYCVPGPMIVGLNKKEARVRVLGPARWPEPVSVNAEDLRRSRQYDGRWIVLRGSVTAVNRVRDGVMLDLLSDELPVSAAIPNWPLNWVLPGYLKGITVTVHGVVSRKPARGAEADQPVICIPSIAMVAPVTADLDALFARPRMVLTNLVKFTAFERPVVKLYGQAGFVRTGRGFFLISSNNPSVWVQTSATGTLRAGDFVDAVGRLETLDHGDVLIDAVFRAEKSAELPEFAPSKAGEIAAAAERFQGKLVRVTGRVMDVWHGQSEDVILLENQGVSFLARWFGDGTNQVPVLPAGTQIQVDGVALTRKLPGEENAPPAFSFQLWLPSRKNIEIIQGPPWWTTGRVFMLCGVVSGVGCLFALWVVALRRQVARQSEAIARQRELHAVAEERARIARELHDTLGQELVGIGLHLDFVAGRMTNSTAEIEQVLGAARKMVAHSQREAKRTVADLRAAELNRQDFPAALAQLVGTFSTKPGPPQLHLQVEGRPLRAAQMVEHHLLRIAQEAVANAVRHAHARKIDVRLRYCEDQVCLEIADDGCGFDAAPALRLASGHFGLLGMEERANKIQGILKIRSRPGAGTVVAVTATGSEIAAHEKN